MDMRIRTPIPLIPLKIYILYLKNLKKKEQQMFLQRLQILKNHLLYDFMQNQNRNIGKFLRCLSWAVS